MNNKIKTRLRHNAQIIRNLYLKKPFPKANVSVIEVYLENGISFSIGATSRVKSPVSIPQPKSQGGQFEPIIDSFSQRIMDTDAEYKALSAIADTLVLIIFLEKVYYIFILNVIPVKVVKKLFSSSTQNISILVYKYFGIIPILNWREKNENFIILL